MDYEEMESELESAGIDPFEFSLMDEVERHEALEEAFLDPWDFEDFDLEYPGYTYSPPATSVSPKPLNAEPSPIIKRPAVTPSEPVNLNPSPVITRPAIDLNQEDAPGNKAVIRKLPAYTPVQGPTMPVSKEAMRKQRQEEIAKIDRKMKQIRIIIVLLASLLLVIVIAGISASERSSGIHVPTYTIQPTTQIVTLPATIKEATITPTAKATPTPVPAVPYVGMYVSKAPSKWQWQGTDNLTVRDTAGNGVRTIKYRFDDPPKIYTIWVRESNDTVVKVSVTDPTAATKPKNSTKKKSASDPYQAKDYAHPDDFYYDYYDDFWDYEDAEDYWEKHH